MSEHSATLTQSPFRDADAAHGAFVISLDFELHWGVCERGDVLTDYRDNLLTARQIIPRLLELFTQFDIRATWATVGMLFFESKEELLVHLPEQRPKYANPKVSTYEYLDLVGADESEDPIHFAPSLINLIANTPGQRIASHTFSHYFCLEEGQTAATFEADLQMAIEAGRLRGINFDSLVFPRNQLNPEYLPIIQRHGFRTYRGNPPAWMYDPRKKAEENLAHRGLRLLDAYLPLTRPGRDESNHPAYPHSPPVNIAANRFLRPYFPTLRRLEEVRLQRIKQEILDAARHDAVYHLWWHPHNFGDHVEENFDFLRRILEYHQRVDALHGLPSLTMAEAAQPALVTA